MLASKQHEFMNQRTVTIGYVPLRNDWEREGVEVRVGIDIVRDTEGVVELIRVDQLQSECGVRGSMRPGNVCWGAALPGHGDLEEEGLRPRSEGKSGKAAGRCWQWAPVKIIRAPQWCAKTDLYLTANMVGPLAGKKVVAGKASLERGRETTQDGWSWAGCRHRLLF